MENNVFCCYNLQPYRPKTLDHEAKFTDFISWAKRASIRTTKHYPYAIQLVRQVNYGRLELTRYFVPQENPARDFVEITAGDLVDANFEKVNSYKNFKCLIHNKFFEVNLYQKDPVNRHHWRATISRPAEEIDIPAKPKETASQQLSNNSLAQETENLSRRSDTGVDIGALNESDSSERWDYSWYTDYGDNSYDSPQDFTTCDKECGYYGHCDY
ncbi:hypothetical protein VE02_08467 [Pseudogymnoascus sp. 03VT05]|nr:hypothetical protein VE02_08467 [Pseudogymnoascus sp. 03VT05]